MADDRKPELGDPLENRERSLCEHEKKFLNDIFALDQINVLNEFRGTSRISGGRPFGPQENIFSSFFDSEAETGGCKKHSKGIKEEEIGPKTTKAPTYAPPLETTTKSRSSGRKPKKISWFLRTPQAGGCEELPKVVEEEEIEPKAIAATAHASPPRTTTKTRSSARIQKKQASLLIAPVCQAGGCEKIPKGIEKEEIRPKGIAAPPSAMTKKSRSSASKQKRISSSVKSPASEARGCEKLPKGIEEEKIVPRATVAPAHAPPLGTTTKSRSSGRKPKKVSWVFRASVSQAGGCEKLPKGIEEEEIEPKAIAAPAHAPPEEIEPKVIAAPAHAPPPRTTTNDDEKPVLSH